MKIVKRKTSSKMRALLSVLIAFAMLILVGCGGAEMSKRVKLDPKMPVTISVWHYYNGAIMNAFEQMIQDFNETVGAKEGIIVEGYGLGNVAELEKAVIASAKGEVGSRDMPNVFASYADTAYEAEKMGILADLDNYFSDAEQEEYVSSYIEEGKIGLNGELRIFPIAKSTEVFMFNETDWSPFATANQLTYEDLNTLEGITRVSELYYNWTDAKTPDILNDGKAFYGRDSMANFFIIASKEFDVEIFEVRGGNVTINIDRDIMKRIWDNYYLPYINGYFTSYGKYRSDDAKVGDIIAYIGSTTSAAYFPSEVEAGGEKYPVSVKVLPTPHFEGARNVIVQQGAGMVVTKSDSAEEYASVVFLKWFTEMQNNISFAALSGYLPVKREAANYDTFMSTLSEMGQSVDDITRETLKVAFEQMRTNELYANKAFDKGAEARNVLERSLQNKAVADREAVVRLIDSGINRKQAISRFDTEENFENWVEALTQELTGGIEQ